MMNAARGIEVDMIAMEQAILNNENETDMPVEEALALNASSLHSREERVRFKLDYQRHVRNIANGNPFYV
jgi:hypothetical protein